MTITICGSIGNTPKMLPHVNQLESEGHTCLWTEGMKAYANGVQKFVDWAERDHASLKVDQDAFRFYFNAIKESDCILVFNFEKNNIPGYIGVNVTIEMAFAHILNKPIYLWNDIPDVQHKAEIVALSPVVISQDFSKIT